MASGARIARSIAARYGRVFILPIAVIGGLMAVAVPAGRGFADTVTWVRYDLPPVFILDGALKGEGVGDRQLLFLQHNLPAFDHRDRLADIARLWYDVKNSPTVCATDVYRDQDREKVALFSARATLVPNYRVLALRSHRADFERFLDKTGALDLDQLGQAEGLKGAYVSGRIHGEVVDRFFNQENRKITLDSVTKGQLLYNILASKRVDFVFAAPSEIIYYKNLSDTPEDFSSFPIAGQSRFIKMYTACSRSALGERVIAEVDHILDSDRGWDDYVAPLKRWVDQADFDMARSQR